jgi:hypothetical protein
MLPLTDPGRERDPAMPPTDPSEPLGRNTHVRTVTPQIVVDAQSAARYDLLARSKRLDEFGKMPTASAIDIPGVICI